MTHFNALPAETFIQRAIDKHGCVYDYSKVVYTNIDTKIKIVCQLHGVFETTPYRHAKGAGCPVHGPFYQTANNHRQGRGCQQCAPSGFDETIPAILYYLEINNGTDVPPVYKIGVTNRTVQERYPLLRDIGKITILKTWEYPLGIDARKTERKIIRMHKDKLYKGQHPLARVGISEMFSEDILMLSGLKNGDPR